MSGDAQQSGGVSDTDREAGSAKAEARSRVFVWNGRIARVKPRAENASRKKRSRSAEGGGGAIDPDRT